MSTLISTDDVASTERYDYWLHMHREHFGVEFRHVSGRRDRLRAHVRMNDLGAVRAVVVSHPGARWVGGGEVHRTPELIRRREVDAYELKLFLSGDRCVVAQGGRQADLPLGDFVLLDPARPSWVAGEGSAPKLWLSLTFPRAMLPLPRGEMARVTGVPLSGRTGSGALVSSLLQRLAGELDAFTPSEAVQVSTAALDLVAAALATRLDARTALPPDVERGALMQRIYAFVDAHLADLELSPSTVAAAHHVSVRQLHKLFEAEECTVAEWIRRRRLDRCRRDLSDPALRHRPVGAIAVRWGFADAAHFNRLFRALHGSPPGEYRLARLGGDGCTAGQSSCRRRQ